MFGGGRHLKTSPSFLPLSKSRAVYSMRSISGTVDSFARVDNPLSSNSCSFAVELYSRMISFACWVWLLKIFSCHAGRFADALEGILNGTVFEIEIKEEINN